MFLDSLYEEFDGIRGDSALVGKKRKRALQAFRNKIGSLRFLDPACGSGNFLTETYLSLRELENDVLNELNDGQMMIMFGGDEGIADNERVSLDQFYGIEVNDFAVRVAKTALWIAQLQANGKSEMLLDLSIKDFPLSDSANIVHGNALRMDWDDVLPASECSYIIGNPPFIGHQWRNAEQQEDMKLVFDGISGCGKLDYVCAWYVLAARYMGARDIHAAFVSTNSICQGESVRILWEPMAKMGMQIDFAYPSFVWGNEASDQAHVHVVIVGFSSVAHPLPDKHIFYADVVVSAEHINGYLFDAEDVFIANRGKPVNPGAPEMTKGSQPTDGGNLILTAEEAQALVTKYPNLREVVRPFMGAREFITGNPRYCLWFKGANLADYNYREIRERLTAVSESRQKSPTKAVRDAASSPSRFTQDRQPEGRYLALPKTTSGRRRYIPIGFMDANVIVSDKLHLVPNADNFLFGLLTSQMHQAWMRVVSGRLKSDYEYSPSVYNSFVFPNVTEEQKAAIEQGAQDVLDARALYPDATLADLYNPDNRFIYPELMAAHDRLDAAVEAAYGVDFKGDEERMVAHLFKLYAQAMGWERG